MDNDWGAVVIDFDITLPKGIDRLMFSDPVNNGIRIMSSDYMSLELRPPYYGDTVNLKFWRLLGLEFGSLSGTAPLTRIDGYLYRYNHSKRVFDVWDDTGTKIVHVDDITSIGDMNIDFTILNSHQFEIIFDPGLEGGIRFIFPAKLLYEEYPTQIEEPLTIGVNNIWLPDRVRPYKSVDYDNPSFMIKHVGGVEEAKAVQKVFTKRGLVVAFPEISSLHGAWDINWGKNLPNNEFVSYFLVVKQTKLLEETVDGVYEELHWLLPILGINMYPQLLPVVKRDEVHNNRPVYEPWLIMGIPSRESKFDPYEPEDPWDPGGGIPKPPIHTVDDEDERFEIPVFDLSPNFI